MNEPVLVFELGGTRMGAPLAGVREVVRMGKLARVPGLAPEVSGLLELRGEPLPVIDVRGEPGAGDVLVVDGAGSPRGLVVDRVTGVSPPAEWSVDAAPAGLPAYVRGLLRDGQGPVLLVDLERLLDGAAVQT